jgi:3-hydroxyisobutyrate dehydrogenase-like beta-hydroxyacid dehydrogenase
MKTTKIAFLGLGLMGSGMASRLLTAGYPLTVYNRTPEKAKSREGLNIGRLASTISWERRQN